MTAPDQPKLTREQGAAKTLGEIAYDTHRAALRHSPALTPAPWWALKPHLQQAWETAAITVVGAVSASSPAYVLASGFPLPAEHTAHLTAEAALSAALARAESLEWGLKLMAAGMLQGQVLSDDPMEVKFYEWYRREIANILSRAALAPAPAEAEQQQGNEEGVR